MLQRIKTVHNPQKKIFVFFTVLVVSFFVLYGYFLNITIIRVVERERTLEEASAMDANLSELEFQYIAMQNSINIEEAYARDFVDIESPIFISRDPKTRSLSLVDDL